MIQAKIEQDSIHSPTTFTQNTRLTIHLRSTSDCERRHRKLMLTTYSSGSWFRGGKCQDKGSNVCVKSGTGDIQWDSLQQIMNKNFCSSQWKCYRSAAKTISNNLRAKEIKCTTNQSTEKWTIVPMCRNTPFPMCQ